MKKRKNIIISAVTCMMSICLMMLGVYAATNPSVSINGQVSYTARDAKVLVRGKANGAKGQAVVDYPSATVTANDVTATKVTDSTTQYLDYTAGTGNSETDNLSPWNIGVLEFAEDSSGVKDIVLSFDLTNLSTYPVQATLTFPSGAEESDLAHAKVSRTASATSAYLAPNGGNKEITVTYKLTDDSQSIPTDADNLLGMNIKFEKAALKVQANSVSEINKNNGLVTMGKSTEDAVEEDVKWKCFAYSTDGATWTKLDSGESIPATAKYGYFILDTYVSSLDSKEFLAKSKYAENSSDSNYYINAGTNGVTEANTVYANDYYYSDVRKTLKGLETTLSISTDSEIYKAIQGRTMTDLYGKMNLSSTDVSLPTGADASDTDTFWLMSVYEASTYFADNDARKWMNGDSGKWYWLRSPCIDSSRFAGVAGFRGVVGYGCDDLVYQGGGARAAFKLQLA